MYIILKCATPATAPSKILGVEFSTVEPTYVETNSDYVYCEVGAGDTVMVNKLLNNIETAQLMVVANNRKSVPFRQVSVTGTNADRKIPEGDWNSIIRPAWYRAVATTDHNYL